MSLPLLLPDKKYRSFDWDIRLGLGQCFVECGNDFTCWFPLEGRHQISGSSEDPLGYSGEYDYRIPGTQFHPLGSVKESLHHSQRRAMARELFEYTIPANDSSGALARSGPFHGPFGGKKHTCLNKLVQALHHRSGQPRIQPG